MKELITMAGDKKENRVVVVTGFGPFAHYAMNASWEAVKQLKAMDIEKRLKIDLVTREIPVVYETVSNVVPKLWSEYNPTLVVHVGVSYEADCLTLESRAHKTGYKALDTLNKYPREDICVINNHIQDNVTETAVDVARICEEINKLSHFENEHTCKAVVSHDAGRYLCEYIFCQSLTIDPKKTIFVHVPELPIYSAKKTAHGLYNVIRLTLEKIDGSRT